MFFDSAVRAVSNESLHDSINKICQLMERWDNRLTHEVSISKAYIENSLELVADFDIGYRGQRGNYRAIFSRADFDILECKSGNTSPHQFQMLDARDSRHGDQKLVFIKNVEIMNGPERFIPSFVRFQSPDYIDDIWAGSVYISLINHKLKVIPVRTKGEVDISYVRVPIETNEIAGKQIKRSPQIVDHIADDGGKVVGDFFPYFYGPHLLTRMRTVIDDDTVRFFFKESPEFVIKFRDVAFGPINL